MKIRITFSALVLVVWAIVAIVYSHTSSPIDASIAAQQVKDSTAAFGATSAVVSGGIMKVTAFFSLGLLFLIWLSPILKLFKRNPEVKFMVLLLMVFTLVSCGPYKVEKYEEIGTNETAFLVPLEGANLTGQQKFMSIDYLNDPKVKVPMKRILIPQTKHDLGYMPGSYEYMPTMRVIKVNRLPVSREWTKKPETGTSIQNQAIGVESQDSINFWVGVTSTGAVTEEDAAVFLYHFAGKPLENVMDQNVRPFIGSILANEFGQKNLNEGRTKKNEIFSKTFTETKDHFKKMGITISNLGSSEGLIYEKEAIQNAIDANFVAEMDKTKAGFEKSAQDERNKQAVATAKAQRESAEEFAKARDAQTLMIQLEIDKMKAQAMLEMAKKVDQIKFPNILPQGTNFFMGLDMAPTGTPPRK